MNPQKKLQKIEDMLLSLSKDSKERFERAEQKEKVAQNTPGLDGMIASSRSAKIEAWCVMVTLKSVTNKVMQLIHEEEIEALTNAEARPPL